MKKLIIVNKPGQLGNRLFVFSHFIAFAIENEYKIINPSFDEYADYFELFRNNNFIKYPVSRPFLKSIITSKTVFIYYSLLFKIVKRIKSPFYSIRYCRFWFIEIAPLKKCHKRKYVFITKK